MLKPVVSAKPSWTVGQLTELKELHISFRGDLTEVAAAVGRTREDCDAAIFALIGRPIREAFIALSRPKPRLVA